MQSYPLSRTISIKGFPLFKTTDAKAIPFLDHSHRTIPKQKEKGHPTLLLAVKPPKKDAVATAKVHTSQHQVESQEVTVKRYQGPHCRNSRHKLITTRQLQMPQQFNKQYNRVNHWTEP